MKRAQLISMDFVLTMVVYIAALSVFFFSIKETTGYNDSYLDIQPELAYGRMDEIDDEIDFLDGSVVHKDKLLVFIDSFARVNPITKHHYAYDLFFADFEDPRNYKNIDYCVYLQDETGYYRRFEAGIAEGYSDRIICLDGIPACRSRKTDSIKLRRPVLYENKIVDLNILACGTRN